MAELGIDVSSWGRMVERGLYRGLGMSPALFFDRETFGVDRLLRAPRGIAEPSGPPSSTGQADPWTAFLADAPLSGPAKRDVGRLVRTPADYLPGLDDSQKKTRLARMSYADFLLKRAGCHPEVLPIFQARPHSLYGLGIDAVSALDAWGLGLPGFIGMKLEPTAGPGMGLDARPGPRSPFFHFPDGNATLARLLVQRLIPPAVAGRGADDVAVARVDYARLDQPGLARLRLDSTVVARAPGRWRRGGGSRLRACRATQRVRGSGCVLACWSGVIPYLCPELPPAQREALAYATKVPIVYTNVVVRSWRSFHALRVSQAHCPGSFHTSVGLDLPVRVGRLPAAAPARRADRRPDAAHAVPARIAGARAAPRRPPGAARRRRSTRSSTTCARSSRACWGRVASTRRGTSWPSP